MGLNTLSDVLIVRRLLEVRGSARVNLQVTQKSKYQDLINQPIILKPEVSIMLRRPRRFRGSLDSGRIATGKMAGARWLKIR